MTKHDYRSCQRGVATMFVTMVLLILITLMVITAYSLSNMNLKAVGNLQTRKEAIAAAESAIEKAVGLETFRPPSNEQTIDIDIDNDTKNDYRVVVAAPTCLRATKATITSASSVTLPGFSAASAWNTVWVLDATATAADAVSGTSSGTTVRVRHGLRVLMTEADRNLHCPA